MDKKEEFLGKFETQRMVFENQLIEVVNKHKNDHTSLENKSTREGQDLHAQLRQL